MGEIAMRFLNVISLIVSGENSFDMTAFNFTLIIVHKFTLDDIKANKNKPTYNYSPPYNVLKNIYMPQISQISQIGIISIRSI
jgi:hypothetical protein